MFPEFDEIPPAIASLNLALPVVASAFDKRNPIVILIVLANALHFAISPPKRMSPSGPFPPSIIAIAASNSVNNAMYMLC